MLDPQTIADAFQMAGQLKQWVAWGVVNDDQSATERSVRFSDESGVPLEVGVLVDVKLPLSGSVVPCRVGGTVAGAGEGEWHPFSPGDEVLVVLPHGGERSGATIVARTNNRYDTFPASVAGMDPTKNNFAFKRLAAAYVIESGTALTLRNAATGSQLTLDPTGQAMLSDGSGNSLFMNADAVSLSLPSEVAGLMLNAQNKNATLFAGNTALVVDAKSSQFQTPGTLSISTGGNGATNHATTIEAVVNLLNTFLVAAATAATAPPALVAFFATFSTPAPLAALVKASAIAPLLPPLGAAITSSFATPQVPGSPNLGAAGLLI